MAYVRLAQGRTSYFDEITRIHLTLANPTAGVPDHWDMSGLQRAHDRGVIVLVRTAPRSVGADGEDAGAPVSEEAQAPGAVPDEKSVDVSVQHKGSKGAGKSPGKAGRKKK